MYKTGEMQYSFKSLKVWGKAHEFALRIYRTTKSFPDIEKYGLSSQLRRSAVSIPSNIVEGYKRKTTKDFAHFLTLSNSSLEESKYHLLLAKDLGYITSGDHIKLLNIAEEVGKMLSGFQKTLKTL